MNTLWAIFLIGHGLLHASYFTPKPDDPNYPFSFENGLSKHLEPRAAKLTGTLLAYAALIGFIIAGLGMLGVAGFSSVLIPAATLGAFSSFLLLVIFWHPWLILGLLIDLVLLWGIWILDWKLTNI